MYDTLVSEAVKRDPLKFVDILNQETASAGDKECLLREASSVIANLLLTDEEWHPLPDGSIEKAFADWQDEIKGISAKLGTAELLAQLAEEAAELTQTALKLRRALDRANPTSMTAADALLNLQEEMADMLLCMVAVGIDRPTVERFIRAKAYRWAERVEGGAQQ